MLTKWCPAALRGFVTTLVLAMVLAFGSLTSGFVEAQTRAFPEQSRLARLEIAVAPDIRLSGIAARLSPGSQIRNTENQILTPAMVQGRPWVRFTQDPQGDIDRVWILTDAELSKEPRQGQAPFRR